jgi:aminoglycoside phosphotransferase (APT) family kinase protein
MSESARNSLDSLPGLNLPAVLRWLDQQAGNVVGEQVQARLIAGGRSNLTYLLDDGERQVVLRRPPLGHVLATAHDMGREFTVIDALADTPVPVPKALALCTDPAVNEAPFYLMSYVEGQVVDSADRTFDPAGKRQLARSMMTTLAELHEVDPAAVGLADFGRPEGFLSRQLSRWWKQLEASRSRELPGIERLRDLLSADVPGTQGDGIVHGDYRLGNLLVAPAGTLPANSPADTSPVADSPTDADADGDSDANGRGQAVRAVLDWEMSTLGDPLADLGLLLAYWDVLATLPSNAAVTDVGPLQGYPDGATLTAWYAERRPALDLSRLSWYKTFGLFKLAVILEGVHYRYTLGQTVGDNFDQVGIVVPALVDAGLATLDPQGS